MLLTFWDILIPPFYLIAIYALASIYKNKKLKIDSSYKYFTIGIFAKIAGSICLALIYQFYYKGGDVTNYFESSQAIKNVFFKNYNYFFDLVFGDPSDEMISYFDYNTGYPIYRFSDKHAFFTSKFYTIVAFFSFGSFITASILSALISFTGIWKLFQVFYIEFPHLKKQLAIAILFIPSVVFWGSGMLKDSITISAVGWYTYAFYNFFVLRKYKNLFLIIYMFIAAYLLIAIKPYILFALLPGSIIWLSNQQIAKIGNKITRTVVAPFLITLGSIVAFMSLNLLGDNLGLYKVDSVMERASIVQQDLKQEYYRGNSFDIGDFEPTIAGMLSKAHLAIFAALFRPSILDVRNPVMLLSAIENTYIMILTFMLLLRLKFIGFFTIIWKNPLVLFSVLFSLFFAFSVGISISNFGSMVRLKIPAIPFFVASLFIIRYYYEQQSGKKLRF